MTPLAPEEHNAHAWAPDPATVPTLSPPCCHRLQRPSRTVAALLLGLDCQALLVCFPEVPPKSSPASPPLTQAERGSKLRGGGGLQEAGVPRPRWLSPQVPLQALSWPWCGSARWCCPARWRVSRLCPFPGGGMDWPDQCQQHHSDAQRLPASGRPALSLEPPLPCPRVPLCGPELPGAGGPRCNWQVSDWAAPVRVRGDDSAWGYPQMATTGHRIAQGGLGSVDLAIRHSMHRA